jgi:hypothetical protein
MRAAYPDFREIGAPDGRWVPCTSEPLTFDDTGTSFPTIDRRDSFLPDFRRRGA